MPDSMPTSAMRRGGHLALCRREVRWSPVDLSSIRTTAMSCVSGGTLNGCSRGRTMTSAPVR